MSEQVPRGPTHSISASSLEAHKKRPSAEFVENGRRSSFPSESMSVPGNKIKEAETSAFTSTSAPSLQSSPAESSPPLPTAVSSPKAFRLNRFISRFKKSTNSSAATTIFRSSPSLFTVNNFNQSPSSSGPPSPTSASSPCVVCNGSPTTFCHSCKQGPYYSASSSPSLSPMITPASTPPLSPSISPRSKNRRFRLESGFETVQGKRWTMEDTFLVLDDVEVLGFMLPTKKDAEERPNSDFEIFTLEDDKKKVEAEKESEPRQTIQDKTNTVHRRRAETDQSITRKDNKELNDVRKRSETIDENGKGQVMDQSESPKEERAKNQTLPVSFYSIFDGHGGKQASFFCKDHFLEVLLQEELFLNCQFEKAIEKSIKDVDAKLLSKCLEEGGPMKAHWAGGTSSISVSSASSIPGGSEGEQSKPASITQRRGWTCGTTLVMALLVGEDLYVANVGDSEAILIKRKTMKEQEQMTRTDDKAADREPKCSTPPTTNSSPVVHRTRSNNSHSHNHYFPSSTPPTTSFFGIPYAAYHNSSSSSNPSAPVSARNSQSPPESHASSMTPPLNHHCNPLSLSASSIPTHSSSKSAPYPYYLYSDGYHLNMLQETHEIINLTEKHHPNLAKEKERIEKSGGRVEDGRVMGGLAMSRAIGDFSYRSPWNGSQAHFVIPDPHIKHIRLTGEEEFIILASDGLWDVMSHSDAAEIAWRLHRKIRRREREKDTERYKEREKREREKGEKPLVNATGVAEFMVRLALKNGSSDNCTIIIIFLS